MSELQSTGLLAVDVGSSRFKLGWFPATGACTSNQETGALPIAAPRLPQAAETLVAAHAGELPDAEIRAWLDQFVELASRVLVASVHPEAESRLVGLLQRQSLNEPLQLAYDDLALDVRVEMPESVGIDRLLSAVAANRLRTPDQPAIVVGAGTATTVNLIAADGAFEGGAILPGMAMSAAALHAGTASLPLVTGEPLDTVPPALGKSTSAALTAGLYWGAVGAIREVVDRITAECDGAAQLFFTGGEAPRFVHHFAGARHVPHMVLSGIAIVAEELP